MPRRGSVRSSPRSALPARRARSGPRRAPRGWPRRSRPGRRGTAARGRSAGSSDRSAEMADRRRQRLVDRGARYRAAERRAQAVLAERRRAAVDRGDVAWQVVHVDGAAPDDPNEALREVFDRQHVAAEVVGLKAAGAQRRQPADDLGDVVHVRDRAAPPAAVNDDRPALEQIARESADEADVVAVRRLIGADAGGKAERDDVEIAQRRGQPEVALRSRLVDALDVTRVLRVILADVAARRVGILTARPEVEDLRGQPIRYA